MVVFLLLSFLVFFNKVVYKSYLNPIFLQSVVWLVYYCCLYLNIDKYDIYLSNVTPFILLQSIGFSLGGLAYALFTKTSTIHSRIQPAESVLKRTRDNVNMLYPFVLSIIIICILILIREVGSLSFFSIMEFRDSLAEDDGKKVGLIGLVQLIVSVYVVTFIATIQKTKKTLPKTIALVVLFFYFTLLLGSKGQVVSFFCASIYLLVWQKKINKKYLYISLVGFIGIITFLLFLRGGGEDIDKESFANLLLIYTVTSLPGLYLSQSPPSACFGYYTFRVVFVWLNKFGSQFPVAPVLNEFVTTPLPTNVYSYIMPYYKDFGLTGVFLIPFAIGLIHNLLYFKANRGSLSILILSALFIYPLVMQIFEENYFRQITNWLYLIIIILLLTKIKMVRSIANVERISVA